MDDHSVLRGGGSNVDFAIGAFTGDAGLPATIASRADWQTYAVALLNKTSEVSFVALDIEVSSAGFVGRGGHGNDRFVINNTREANIRGAEGNDYISTGTPDDTLDGGVGADTMMGGGGSDTYWVDNVGDVVTDSHGTNDLVYSLLPTYTLAANIERLYGATAAGQTLIGNALANTVYGNGGDDYIDGGVGADTMDGGTGNDTYVVGNTGDQIIERADGGWDQVFTTVSFAGGEHIESLTAMASGAELFGGSTANLLVSRFAATRLTGGDGNDVYVVGAGQVIVSEAANAGYDTLIVEAITFHQVSANIELVITRGSNTVVYGTNAAETFLNQGGANVWWGEGGNDSFIVTHGGETISEEADEGNDSVFAGVSYTLRDHVESLYLRGNGLTGTGNNADNVIASEGTGNTLIGRGGSDAYLILTGDEVVVEAANEGYDVIYSVTDFAIATNVEALVLTGAGRTATGGAGGDLLMSAAFNNTLNGGAGGDLLLAGAYGDRLIGGTGGDVFAFQAVNGGGVAQRFRIDDFNRAEGDIVDLWRMDANSTMAGQQAWVGKAAFNGQPGQLVLTNLGGGAYRLAGDVDGDAVADFVVDIIAPGGFGWGDVLT